MEFSDLQVPDNAVLDIGQVVGAFLKQRVIRVPEMLKVAVEFLLNYQIGRRRSVRMRLEMASVSTGSWRIMICA